MSRLLFNLGLLTQIDGAALASYCASYGRWRQAEEDLADSGLLLKNTSGNVIQNPLVGIADQAQRDMVKILVEFGDDSFQPVAGYGCGEGTLHSGRDFKWSR